MYGKSKYAGEKLVRELTEADQSGTNEPPPQGHHLDITGGAAVQSAGGTGGRGAEFDAIHIVNGVAVVDKEACKACGKCVAVCPKHLIEIVPYDQKHLVKCNSQDKGKAVMQACTAGCIGCKMCEKACKFEAVTVENNIAHIDYEKCKDCGACAVKCPKKVIS